jgi:choline dehydrogenase-like flavoprotein
MRKVGYRPFPTPVAINSRPYGGRPECAYGGACLGYGCQIHAKATTLSVCIPRALATGKLDLRPNATAREITMGKDGRARSVRYLDEQGREHEVFARNVVVSGNAIGTPHLLLMSANGAFPQGLANSSGLVGRNLTLHHIAAIGFTIDEPARSYTGLHSHIAFDDLHASDAKRGFIRGGVIAEANSAVNQPLSFALFTHQGYPKRSWGPELKDYLRKFPRAVGMAAVLEDLPMEVNQIDLDATVKDRHGLPAPRITHRQHPNDFAMNRWFTQRMFEVADAAGAIDKWDAEVFSLPNENSAMKGFMHFHGTCRMGDDPQKSVVDRWCRSHDVENLWIVDGSPFPTSGGYNPTLTILANSYRVADHFVGEAKRQNV